MAGSVVSPVCDRTAERRRVTASSGERARAVLLAGLVVVSVVAVGVPALGERASAQSGGTTLVVGGSGSYSSIQNAVDNASEGDTVEVRPGTYTEPVDIRKNITLVAPDGATVANTSAPAGASIAYRAGIQVFGPTTPTVEGFTIEGWSTGFSAGASEGAWTLRDTTIRDTDLAVGAAGTPAPWMVDNVTVVNTTGLSAYQSSGDWVVRDSTFSGRESNIFASESTGDWTVEGTTIRNVDDTAVNAIRSSGRWTIRDSVVTDTANNGIAADETSGDWTLVNVTVSDVEDDAVDAYESDGNWTVRRTTVTDASDDGINGGSSSGNWEVRDTVVTGATDGVSGYNSTGDWTVRDTKITDVSDEGTNGVSSSGDWEVRETIVTSAADGVNGFNSTGDWTVRDTSITNVSTHGVNAYASGGDWTVVDATVRNASANGVYAENAVGAWEVHESTVVDTSRGVDATNATVAGDATRNYWGATDGPSGDFPGGGEAAVGNVSVEPFYTDAGLTALGTFDATGPLVVNKSDPQAYDSIQNAVDDASEGDTVEVRPGTYAESVTVAKNVTLVAPSGATIENGSAVSESTAVEIGDPDTPAEPNTPTVEGFTLAGWQYGVYDTNEAGAWTVRDVTVDATAAGVVATDSSGAWTVENVAITGARLAVNALDSSGDWRLDGAHLADVTEGVTAGRSTGDWVARDVTVRNASNAAVDAPRTTGDWRLENGTIRSSTRYGVVAEEATGAWTVVDSTVRTVALFHGVDATNTTSAWTVRNTTVANASGSGVAAVRSDGAWTVANATFVDTGDGVTADDSTGDWTVRNTLVDTVANDGVGAEGSSGDWAFRNGTVRDVGDDGVDAVASTGAWSVRNTTLTDTGEAVDASDATIAGNATRNYWGATDGPSGDFSGSGEAAVGNVSVEPFYTDAGLSTLGTFDDGGVSVANVTLTNPTGRSLEVTVTTTGAVSGLAVDLGNGTTTTGSDLTLADGEFTETARGDGRYDYVASATADVADGSSATYRASVTSVDGRATDADTPPASSSLTVAAARTTNGAATVRTGSTTVPEATVTLDGGVESNVTVSTGDTVPDVPGQNETALRADLAAVDDDDAVLSALTVNVDPEDADTPATLRLRVDADAVGGDPAGLVVARNDGAGYETLETTVVETTDDAVVVEARSPEGFSVFAVVDTDESLATTPAPDPDRGGGGGGGGGGGSSGAFALDERSVTQRLDDAGVASVTVEFDRETTGTVRIRADESLPVGAPAPDGTVLAVVDVSPPADAADRPGRLEVTLDRAALGDVDPSRLRIVRYDGDGSLQPLSTRLVRDDDRLVVLSAATAGYGSFAVVAGDRATTTPSATSGPTATPDPTATPTTQSEPTGTRTASPSTTPAAGDGLGVVAALVAVLAAALLARRE
ncbi:MAG: right-handed parallel beta-helix repeat-containing protein [Haloferacaceae archaeon]